MRRLIVAATLAAFTLPAFAQQPPTRPAAPPAAQPRKPAAQAQPAQPPQPAPGMFPCRTQGEVCHILVVTAANQGTLIFSNAPKGMEVEGKPVTVQGADLGQNVGRVAMLAGELSGTTVSNAEVIEIAGPLLSFVVKSSMSGEDSGGAARGQPPRGQPAGSGQPRR
jgi:hypothetical protein